MPLVLATLHYPTLEQFDLLCGEFLAAARRWHVILGVLREDSLDEQTLLGFARNDHAGFAFDAGPAFDTVQSFARIEPQVGFAFVFVRTMTEKTIVR